MSILVMPETITLPEDEPLVALLPEFKPSEATRHARLSGIEKVQNVLTDVTRLADLAWQTFHLPTDYARAGKDIPDITGFQICVNTLVTLREFGANLTLQVDEYGSWTTLTEGSVRGNVVKDEKEWIDAYFTLPIQIKPEWLTRQFRIGVQCAAPVWFTLPAVDLAESSSIGGGQLCYKLLTFTADDDEDFLSNRYRSVVRRAAISNVSTQGTVDPNSFWYSKPNPSKYAVESLYFDVRDGNHNASVVDRLLLDPITPGVYFNLYYSTEGEPGTEDSEWEQKLWTPIYQIYKAERRTEHALPEPVNAKYMKVEFSHLQAQHYSPGTFAQPLRYKKHPKWVLDYFLGRLNAQTTEDPFIARRVRVVFDAMKLGYNYHVADLQQEPTNPNVALPVTDTDTSNQIDEQTMSHISTELRPYSRQPAERAKGLEYLVAEYAQDTINLSYPVEQVTPARADTTQVSQLDRENLVVEANYPVMFFYVPSRHTYRVVEAPFTNDRAYFVGIRELAFTREHYTVASDQSMYVENLGDWQNVIRNDFLRREEPYVPFNPNPNPSP